MVSSRNPFKFLQLFFYPPSAVTIFYLFIIIIIIFNWILRPSAGKCQPRTEKAQGSGCNEWVPSACLRCLRESSLSKLIPETLVQEGTGLRENCWLRKINWYPELYFPYFFHSSIKLQSQLLLVCILLWWLKNTVQLPNKFILQFS